MNNFLRNYFWVMLVAFGFGVSAFAGQAVLQWDPPLSANGSLVNVSNYNVYYGTSPNDYTQSVSAGSVTGYTFDNLAEGNTYYFAVRAEDSSGNLSGYSNEVSKSFITQPPVGSLTLTASASAGGTISPSGPVSVASGSSKTFTVTPNSGYSILDVTVDGVSKGAINSFTFTNITANHTIAATFKSNTVGGYTFTATAGVGGTISPSGTLQLAAGTTQVFTFTPNAGYSLKDITVDGVLKAPPLSGTFTFTNISRDHTISASFVSNVPTHAFTASAGVGGTISPSGSLQLAEGSTQTFVFTPNSGYSLKSITVDGVVKAPPLSSSFTFTNISEAHTISAAFVADVVNYTVTASAGTGGTISPAGAVTATAGSSKTFTITPNSGYSISGVTVDGVAKGAISTYTFSNIAGNHTISATFAAQASSTVVGGINCGGPAFRTSAGIAYKADSYSNGGGAMTNNVAIANTTDDVLFQTYRYGYNFGYSIPVPNGTYSLKLMFADGVSTRAGQRLFDITVQGVKKYDNLDVFAKAGGQNRALTLTIPVTVSNGTLSIVFAGGSYKAFINAILLTK